MRQPKSQQQPSSAAAQERLAAALRANLQKRKAQARARETVPTAAPAATTKPQTIVKG